MAVVPPPKHIPQQDLHEVSGPKNLVKWARPPAKALIGYRAWLFHRITGFIIVLFLIGHIIDIIAIKFYPPFYEFNDAFFTRTVLGLLVEVFLWWVLCFHGFNGIRIILFDLGIGVRKQKQVFYIMMILAWIAFFAGAAFLLMPVFDGSIKVWLPS